MIFVDSNIPMYLIGTEHPNKLTSRRSLEDAVRDEIRLVTDAEVYQEILHRYTAIDRREAIAPALTLLDHIVDEVYSIEKDDVTRAAHELAAEPRLSARDAIHLAIMRRHGVRRILTFDQAFDRFPDIERIS